jgi:RNA polymerase sigma factor (sigma-70 family)
MDEVTALVVGAAEGDDRSWAGLVDRYSSLLWAIARNHRLSTNDAADVVQTVWLKLAEHLHRIVDPRSLPGWLSTTTRRECTRVARVGKREEPRDTGPWMERADGARPPDPVHEVAVAERDLALWEALGELDPRCSTLLRVLCAEPPLTYDEVSQALDIPVGSIGPTRGRCLDKLRRGIVARGITEDALRSV